MSYDCVVDASVAIKLFLREELSDRAAELFARLTGNPPPRFFVPDHFFIECSNVLWKYVRLFGYDLDSALQDLLDLRQLPWHSLATRELAQASLELGLEYGIAAYDAAYVVLAESVELPLVTADEKLLRRLLPTDCDVRWLGDWPLFSA